MENNQPDLKEQFEDDLQAFALKYGVNRLKLETLHFDRDYRREGDTAELRLVSEKAIVRALGKVSKVPIGPDQPYQTYEEAAVFARNHWSEYFKKRRAKRTAAERRGEARRQKHYREQRKQEATKVKRQQ